MGLPVNGSQGPSTVGQKFISNEYPNVEGLIALTTKQTLDPDLEETP